MQTVRKRQEEGAQGQVAQVLNRIEAILAEHPQFTGKIELNFKDGIAMDANVTTRHKFVAESSRA